MAVLSSRPAKLFFVCVCILQVRKDWKAVVHVETEDLSQMPIVDFAPGEFLSSNEFGFEVGPICFS